ncbi:MAG: 30S ribosomal protein S12 methylthiotransferase RimO [bacterium]|nr:30S ribosomal protein S12 methylthiotransferase RimO [bacterium]
MKNLKTFSAISLGCPKNLVDTEVILGLLKGAGYEVIFNSDEADIVIINTCAFIKPAVEESRAVIREELKKKKKIVVIGCLVQRYGDELWQEFPDIACLVTPGEINNICNLLHTSRKLHPGTPEFIYSHNTPRLLTTLNFTAYVKIADGCNNCCSYCLIPKLRGRFRSRPIEDIVKEVEKLALSGVKEIILIAQDTTFYGMDIYGKPELAQLLKELSRIESIQWIRIMYTHPAHLTEEIISIMKEEEKICPYIDIPLQHIEDRILKDMNRPLSGKQVRALIKRLREAIPDIAIRTSLMVGFPTETDGDFKKLVDFVKEVEFDRLGVFKYFAEEGTSAASMSDHVPEQIKEERYNQLLKLQLKISRKKLKNKIGKRIEVVIERLTDELTYARSKYDAPDIDGLVIIAGKIGEVGELVKVEVIGSTEYDLMAKSLL